MFHGYSTLGLKEEIALREIAMPSYRITKASMAEFVNIENPITSTNDMASGKQVSRHSSKRQKITTTHSFSSSTHASEEDTGWDNEREEKEVTQYYRTNRAQKKKKEDHNVIEKRYRSSLNDKILGLDRCIRPPIPENGSTPRGAVGGNKHQQKSTKSAILTRAVEHIESLETNARRSLLETKALNTRVAAFEQLALSGNLWSGT